MPPRLAFSSEARSTSRSECGPEGVRSPTSTLRGGSGGSPPIRLQRNVYVNQGDFLGNIQADLNVRRQIGGGVATGGRVLLGFASVPFFGSVKSSNTVEHSAHASSAEPDRDGSGPSSSRPLGS